MDRGFAKSKMAKSYKIVTYTALALAITFLFFQSFIVQRWPTPHIRAEAYAAPAGCIVKQYKELDKISNSCRDEKYRLPYFYTLVNHLNNGGGRGYFDRVDNDVIKIGCSIFDGSCSVDDVTYNVYY